jgi:putative ABC transport system substrate-binding protein
MHDFFSGHGMFDRPQRREIITLMGGAAAASLLSSGAARAQQGARVRRIGVLHDYVDSDPEGQAQLAAFRGELKKLGWTEWENYQLIYRSGVADTDTVRSAAAAIMAEKPDVVIGAGGTIVAALQRASRSVPIVFVNVTDPVGGGLIANLAHPGGTATGFTQFEFGISAKWLELLNEIAPSLRLVAVVRDPTARSGGGQLGAIQAAAPAHGIEVRPIDPQDAETIERGLGAFSDGAKAGMIVTSSRLARLHRDLIISLAARNRMPAIYAFRVYVEAGGLSYYGPDAIDPYRRAAGYVDRILKGEKPADLPVQAPTKYELVINLKTAKALGLDVPAQLLARADEVIE